MLSYERKKVYLKELVSSACNSTECYKDTPVFDGEISNKFGYVYITILRCKGYVYIGQHKSSIFDRAYIGSGIIISNARKKKYTREDFFNQPLEFASSQNQLNQLEVAYIAIAKEIFGEKCLNIAKGGFDTAMIHTDNAKVKSKKTYIKKFGKLMSQCHTLEAESKSARTHARIYGSVVGHMLTQEAKNKKDTTFIEKYNNRGGRLVEPEIQKKASDALIDKYGTNVGRMHDPDVRIKAMEKIIEKHDSICAYLHTEEAHKKAFESRAKGHNGNFMWMVHNPESQRKAAISRKGKKQSEKSIKKRVYNRLVKNGVYYKANFINRVHYFLGLKRLIEYLSDLLKINFQSKGKCRDKAIRKLLKEGISKKNYKYWNIGLRAINIISRPKKL